MEKKRPGKSNFYQRRFYKMADDTAALLHQVGITKADVFGYSTKGSVALHLAGRHRDLVRKLALASATLFSGNGKCSRSPLI